MTYPTIEEIVREMILPNLMDEISEWSGELSGKYEKSDTYYVDEIKNEVIRQLTPQCKNNKMEKGSIKNKMNYRGDDFYWGNTCINNLWHNFFSSLSSDKEKDCLKIFMSRYKKTLRKLK